MSPEHKFYISGSLVNWMKTRTDQLRLSPAYVRQKVCVVLAILTKVYDTAAHLLYHYKL